MLTCSVRIREVKTEGWEVLGNYGKGLEIREVIEVIKDQRILNHPG